MDPSTLSWPFLPFLPISNQSTSIIVTSTKVLFYNKKQEWEKWNQWEKQQNLRLIHKNKNIFSKFLIRQNNHKI